LRPGIDLVKHFDPHRIIVETKVLTLAGSRVPWDEETFQQPIACLDRIEVRERASAARDYRAFLDWSAAMRIALCSVRIPQRRIVESMFLEEQGFRFLELTYAPYLDDLQNLRLLDSEIKIVPAAEDDRQGLAALAGRTFRVGRYHMDPRVDGAAADRRYGQWVSRAFANASQRVFKCLRGDEVIGFFVVQGHESDERFWSLIGLAPEFIGCGLGYRTWTAMLKYHQEEGVRKVTTSISSHNIAVMNLYVKLGFRFPEPQVTLHWCPEEGGILGR
jgi:RimJ/RimL family protein N-acetyltransferase